MLSAIKNGLNIKHIKNPCEAFQMHATSKEGRSIAYILKILRKLSS
jgi:hypothetical protein